MRPQQVVDLIIGGEREARKQIWLIPSENMPSPLARLALASSVVNRYLFKHDYQGGLFCPGTETCQRLYDYCVEALKKLCRAKYVSLRPISGMNGMTMVITTYARAGDTVCSLPPAFGGHTHTEKIAVVLGREVCHIPMVPDGAWFAVDYDLLARDLKQKRPALVYIDGMSVLYEIDVKRLREVTPESCALHYDASHVMGFVAGGVYANPLDQGFSSMSGSTHKTLPGVQKGFFATNNEEYFRRFEKDSGQQVSSLHAASVLGLAVVLAETEGFYERYAAQILENARHLANCLEGAGFCVFGRQGRKTDCHVLFVGVEPYCDAVEACHRLFGANIVTHPILLPMREPTKGLRLGLQEVTVLGMGKSEMEAISDIFRKILIENVRPEAIGNKVAEMRKKFPWPSSSCLDNARMKELFEAMFD